MLQCAESMCSMTNMGSPYSCLPALVILHQASLPSAKSWLKQRKRHFTMVLASFPLVHTTDEFTMILGRILWTRILALPRVRDVPIGQEK